MRYELPAIDKSKVLEGLSPEHRDIVEGVFNTRNDKIRSTKPKDGRSAYVWRLVMFMMSRNPAHQCMPVMLEFYLEESHYAHRTETYQPRLETEHDRQTVAEWDEQTRKRMNKGARRRAYMEQELKPLVDRIVDSVHPSELHGVRRWGRALGVL
jgi:hypothetical protein